MTDAQSKRAAQVTQSFEGLARAGIPPSPFVQVLLQCAERRASGSLSVRLDGRGQLWVRIEGGFPTAVAGDGVADTVQQTLSPLCTLQHGGYAFHEGADRVSDAPGMLRGPVDPHALLAEAFRQAPRAAHVQQHVSLSDARVLGVARGVNLARYRFTEQERRVADRLLSGPTSVAALASERNLNASVVRRVVYVLELTGALLDVRVRDESGRRAVQRSELPAQPAASSEDPRVSHARPLRRNPASTPLPEIPAHDPVPPEAIRRRDGTLPLGALAAPAQPPPGALPPPSHRAVPAPTSQPSAARAPSTRRTATLQMQAVATPLQASAIEAASARAPAAQPAHPIATPPARRRLRSPAGGYSVARPEHGEHTLQPTRARKASEVRSKASEEGAEARRTQPRPRERPLSLPMPPASLSAVHRGRWHEVLDRYRRLYVDDHFLALGVPRTVDASRLDAAFRTELARFQPSHLPSELSPVRPHAEVIVEALHIAYDTLRDPGRRTAYLQRLSSQR